MIAARSFAGSSVGIFGLARSGLSAARAFHAGGARVYAWDDKDAGHAEQPSSLQQSFPGEEWPWARSRR